MKRMGMVMAATVTAVGFVAGEAEARPLHRGGFGASMVVNGEALIVGEPDNLMRSGLVYVYERAPDGSWVEAASFGAEDGEAGDGFGASLATHGDLLLVGGSGGVHGFVRDGGAWREEGMLPAPETLGEDAAFGATLALSGDVALVGAPGAFDGAGVVHVYRRDAEGWTGLGPLTAEGLEAGDGFGAALAFDGAVALVGAPSRDRRSGGVFAYEVDAGSLRFLGEIGMNGLRPGDRFGSSLLLDGDVAAVGAWGSGGGVGAVYTFSVNDRGWGRGPTLAPFDPTPRAGFGTAMARVDGDLWVGAPGAEWGAGAVYAFRLDESGVAGAQRIRAPAFEGRVQAGGALAAGSDFVAVATPSADRGAGTVVMFEESSGIWVAEAAVRSPPDGYDAVRGGEVPCTDGSAVEWACSEVDLVSFLPVLELTGDGARGVVANDNWGWQDPETGRRYALVGMTDRVSFVDVTDVTDPVVVGILPMTEGANGSDWRDLKTHRDHVYVVSDGAGRHGMQVFDLTRLRDFDGGEPVVFSEDLVYDRIASAHNIVINEDSGYAYVVGASGGGETCGGGLHMIDIREPSNPTFAGCFADPRTGRASSGYSHDAQCVNYVGPDPDYAGAEICLGANETALSIADVTDKANPVAVSRAAYPSVAYSHQGWLTEDHRYFYLNDELDEIQGVERTRTLIWDVSDLDDPQLVAEHLGTQASSDHNLYIVGNLMYQANYTSGLRVLDISTPEAPTEVAWFDTVAYGDDSAGTSGAWSSYPFFDDGVVLVTSENEGLFLLRPTVRRTVF